MAPPTIAPAGDTFGDETRPRRYATIFVYGPGIPALKRRATFQPPLRVAEQSREVAQRTDELSASRLNERVTTERIRVTTERIGRVATYLRRVKQIGLSWKKLANAKSYTIQFSPDPPTPESWVTGCEPGYKTESRLSTNCDSTEVHTRGLKRPHL
jgi:hypothetical protein